MIGIYCRISTRQQEDKYSISTQMDLGQKFASSLGEPFAMYVETGSGKDIENRREFERLLSDVENRTIDKVWVVESSRLTRDLQDAIKVQKLFNSNNVTLYIDGNRVSLDSAESILQYNVISAVSQYERTKIVERSIRGKSEQQNQGKLAFPNIYGYNYSYNPDGSKSWYIDNAEAEVVRLIFDMYTNKEMSFNQIMIHLNKNGYTTKKDKSWHRGPIKKLLNQSLYIGKAWTTTGEEIDSQIYEPIVDEDLFRRTQIRLSKASRGQKSKNWKEAKTELTGIIKCKNCGAPFFYGKRLLKSGDYRYFYYHYVSTEAYRKCKQKPKVLFKDNMDRIFEQVVFDEMAESDSKISAWLSEYKRVNEVQRSEYEHKLEINKVRLEQAIKRRKKIVDLITDGVYTRDDAKDNMLEVNKTISQSESEIKSAQKYLLMNQESEDDELYRSIIELITNFKKLTPLEKRNLYKAIFKKVIIDDNKLLFVFLNGTEHRRLFENLKE